MFGANLGIHIIQFPSKRFGYVGTLPVTLATEVTATAADVYGCRTHRAADGALMAWKFPSFDTEAEARAFAESKGVALAN